jgi:hypothetical protein
VSRPSPFVVILTATQRRVLEGRLRRPTAQQREVVRARIVLAAADGEQNTQIAGGWGWRSTRCRSGASALSKRDLAGSATASDRAGRAASPSAVVVQAKAIACELPAVRAVPLGRWSLAELREEVITTGLVDQVSVSTLWRWLNEDAIKPWQHRSWIFPRDPDFTAKAGVVLDLYQRRFRERRLEPGEFVVSADEKTSIQARCRCHPSLPPAMARMMRVEHEYERGGALAYLAAWDVHQARLFGRCEPSTGIVPFGRLVDQVMTSEPYRSAHRVFWVVDNGSSHRGQASIDRLQAAWSNLTLVHLPVHASWLNQIEIYFSVVQRKVLTPNDFTDLAEVERRLLGFQRRYEQTAVPFDWRFTRADLHDLLRRLDEKEQLAKAA